MTTAGSVLIIDDEAGLRLTLSRILQKIGCSATGAANGFEALRLLTITPFDLIYLDLHLPDMDGMQILQEIRKFNPKVPVVLLTAHGSMDSALKAMRLGATDYLIKPVNPEQLISRTMSVLKEQETERRRKELQAQIAALQDELRLLDGENPYGNQTIQSPTPSDTRYIRRGLLLVDMQARRITFGEREIDLPPASFDYFLVLARHAPEVVSYQMLISEAQGYQAGLAESRELSRWHVHVIRQALEVDPASPRFILNVRGQGYRLLLD
jgi:DNA-binding response OmpR family regulator